jgi:uncharacterized membrane protein YcaP (DUF421 family)
MWANTTPLLELVFRGVVIYVVLLILMRVGGKQQVGQLAPFDFVLLLIIGNSVENAMTGGDDSLTAGLVLAATLIGAALLTSWLHWRWRRVERLIDGEPRVVINNGQPDETVMRQERVTMAELMTALRENGCFALEDVRFAVIETNGRISVLQKDAASSAPRGAKALQQSLVG